MNLNTSFKTLICIAVSVLLSAASMSFAQPDAGRVGGDGGAFKQEELEQLVAPIALYPDSLVSQILMASTYPLEVVQAERWAEENKGLRGDALAASLEKQTWDPSVRSLVNFPEVLTMMSEQLDWTQKLGDAFLAQQKEVLDAVQKLRSRAKAEGNLESTDQQNVVVQEDAGTQYIVIESSSPEIVYVPTYDPVVVYGTWPYPAYPPYYYYPPGYVPGRAALYFGMGVACGAAWGYAWGGCNWHHGDVDIDIDRNAFVNNRIDRSRYRSDFGNRNRQGGRGSWQHDPAHRKSTPYRDANAAQRFDGTSAADAARARDSYRGRADAGRQDLARGGADQFRRGQSPTGARPVQPDRGGAASRQQPASRMESRPQNRGGAADRPSPSQGSRGGAFDGAGQGQSARRESSRGQASRSSPSRSTRSGSASRGGGSRGGGSRGGMSRGGGGGRGGRGAGYENDNY